MRVTKIPQKKVKLLVSKTQVELPPSKLLIRIQETLLKTLGLWTASLRDLKSPLIKLWILLSEDEGYQRGCS